MISDQPIVVRATAPDDALRRRAASTPVLLAEARARRDATRRDARKLARTTLSRKLFIPLTQLCRDICHYCTFAKAPRKVRLSYMPPDKVLAVPRASPWAQSCGGSRDRGASA